VVAHPRRQPVGIGRLDDDQVDAQRETRQRPTAGQASALEEPADRAAEPRTLTPIDRFLGQPVVTATAPADLDDHELRWRTRIDRDDIELTSAGPHIPGQDRPSSGLEAVRRDLFGHRTGIAWHRLMIGRDDRRGLDRALRVQAMSSVDRFPVGVVARADRLANHIRSAPRAVAVETFPERALLDGSH
jgi:hypothetical protein